MAWLYEKSGTWRRIVAVTKANPAAMVAFTAACGGLTYWAGQATMGATNPQLRAEQEQRLRASTSMHQKAMSRANRERLAVLLEETRQGRGNERYAAALRGKSLGTHSGGTTVGARPYNKQPEPGGGS